MSDNKAFSTYAITVYFDDDTTTAIRQLTAQLADITGNDYMTANSVPPHLTLGMFHAGDADVGKLKTQFEAFVSAVREGDFSFDLSFSGYESFLDKVIFIKPALSEELCKFNELLHERFLPHFEPADNRNYLPGNWYPHIALGVKLSHEQFEKGMEFLKGYDAQGIGGAPEAATGLSEAREAAGGDSRNPAKPGLPSGRCARITTIGLACCNPYTRILDLVTR